MATKKVKVRTFRGYSVCNEQDSLLMAKRLMRHIKEDGYSNAMNWATIEDEESGEQLGYLHLEGDDTIIAENMSERVLTLKGVLA